ncbi:MAG: aminotransferase class IV [Nitrospirae bacterium]|nr:aminotransferase class IV [Nitrospirota bacterium]
MKVHLNGQLVNSEDARVSVFDRGFLYGDGAFETMRVYDGVAFKLQEHVERLFGSLSMLGIVLPVGQNHVKQGNTEAYDHIKTQANIEAHDYIKAIVRTTVLANGLRDAYVRVTVTRGKFGGPGPGGIDTDGCDNPTVLVVAAKLTPYPALWYEKGIRVATVTLRRNLPEALDARIKSLNFLNNVLARAEAKKAGAQEGLMLNHRGYLAECTVANIFFVKGGTLFTPSMECGILDGITRRTVINLARQEGIVVQEGEFFPDAFHSADEVFVTSSIMEIMPVAYVDETAYVVGKTTIALGGAFKKYVTRYVEEQIS